MANDNLLTLTLIPNGTTNSTTVTLGTAQNTAATNSYSSSMQFAQNIRKSGGVVDDAGRWISADAIVLISIS